MTRHTAKILLLVCVLTIPSVIFLIGCGQESPTGREAKSPKGLASSRVLATIPDETQNLFKIDFSPQGDGVAFVQETGGKVRVVINDRPGRFYRSIGTMVISPDGKRVAYTAFERDRWRVVVDERELSEGKIGTPVFSPDSRHVIYETLVANNWRLMMDGDEFALTQEGYFFHDKFFTTDSRGIVTVESPEQHTNSYRITVRDLRGKQMAVLNVEGKNLGFNKERTMVAFVEAKDGQERLGVSSLGSLKAVKYSPWYDSIVRYAFSQRGDSVAYVAERAGKRYLVLNGKESPIPKEDSIEVMVVQPDRDAAAFIMNSRRGSYVYRYLHNKRIRGKVYDEIAHLTFNKDASRHVYMARKGRKVFVVVNEREGPAYDMAVSPLFSPDDKYLVYRARKDGRRFVVVADRNGKTIRQLPSYEQVFPVVFTDDGKSIAYGVKDGNRLIWKVEKLDK